MPELPWKTGPPHRRPRRCRETARVLRRTPHPPPAPNSPSPTPGFENGGTGWTFGAGTGVATGNSHGGARFLYLDSGPGKSARRVLEQQAAVGPQFFERGALIGEQDGHFRLFLKVVLPPTSRRCRSGCSRCLEVVGKPATPDGACGRDGGGAGDRLRPRFGRGKHVEVTGNSLGMVRRSCHGG
ncbi:hypothetical protein ACFVXW_12910 [Streptomyces sp. NPDC058251]|uniref:hypothetical protein n=1 Tax=Streptomyces sp. NPDC058251 TaxID=3346404 RepID=UPI0036EFF68F